MSEKATGGGPSRHGDRQGKRSRPQRNRRAADEPTLVWAGPDGRILDAPGWRAAARTGNTTLPLRMADLVPLPEGSELFLLPGRRPVGYRGGRPEVFAKRGAVAVGAFLPPAWTQHLLPAGERNSAAPVLPLYAYTAVCFARGRFMVPATRVDPDTRQDPAGFDCELIEAGITHLLEASPGNRLLRHLTRCAREYFCPAARNLFQGRHEAPLPSSPACNARCIGCISLQPSGCCPSTQERIAFVPTPEELAEVALGHFSRVPRGVASFGQGCEGEPLLVADTLVEATRLIRKGSDTGTVNLNTNGSRPREVERLADAGLDTIRVSLNSARRELYDAYYRPSGYSFDDVVESVRVASRRGVFTCLNYFVFPGVTDAPEEVDALEGLIEAAGVRMIQWRNLNIDPDLYLATVPAGARGIGIPEAMAAVRRRFPHLRHGYFNPAVREAPAP